MKRTDPKYLLRHRSSDQKEPGMAIPPKMFLYLILGSISMLFATLSMAYIYIMVVRSLPSLSLPIIFHANTVILLTSSVTMHFSLKSLQRGDMSYYTKGLGVTFALGAIFLLFQTIGWLEMMDKGVYFNNQSGTYLYLISGLHGLHILGGLIVIGFSLFKAINVISDPIKELVASTDPALRTRIQLMSLYWHFVDVLWVYLYLLFVVRMLV